MSHERRPRGGSTWRQAADATPTHLVSLHGFHWARVKGRWALPVLGMNGQVHACPSAAAKAMGRHPTTVARQVAVGLLAQPSLPMLHRAWPDLKPGAIDGNGPAARRLAERVARLAEGAPKGSAAARQVAEARQVLAGVGHHASRDDLMRAIIQIRDLLAS